MDRVAEFALAHGLLAGVRRVRVGFSGGADSTALLLLVRGLHADVEAVHLHHGLRGPAADGDALWCERFCAERDIRFTCARIDVPRHRRRGESLEEAARRRRLEYWAATTDPADAVALGHHLDDCLEDMLLRLARGANSGGLTALRPLATLEGVRVLRPLLCLRRAEIEEFLDAQGVQDWRRDATNDEIALRRNAVRHQWLPLLRQTVGHDRGLVRSLEALREDADCLAALAREHAGAVRDLDALRRLHPALLPRVLRLWLREETGRDVVLPREALLRLRRELGRTGAGGARRVPVGQGRWLALGPGGLRLVSAAPRLTERTWVWAESPRLEVPEVGAVLTAETLRAAPSPRPDRQAMTELFAAEALVGSLQVRSWRPGDRMVPFGRRRPVKLQDLFTKDRIARDLRPRLPVVLCGETVIWVPGLRRAEFGRVTPGTPAVRLRFCTTRARNSPPGAGQETTGADGADGLNPRSGAPPGSARVCGPAATPRTPARNRRQDGRHDPE